MKGKMVASKAMSVTVKFCPICKNQLYPKEDKKRKILLNACRTCSYTEEAENYCVYRNVIKHTDEEPPVIRRATSSFADLTVHREKGVKCPVCNHPEVTFSLINPRKSLARMNACCNWSCRHKWIDEDPIIVL